MGRCQSPRCLSHKAVTFLHAEDTAKWIIIALKAQGCLLSFRTKNPNGYVCAEQLHGWRSTRAHIPNQGTSNETPPCQDPATSRASRNDSRALHSHPSPGAAHTWLCPKPIMCSRHSCQQQPLHHLPAPNQIKPTELLRPCRLQR